MSRFCNMAVGVFAIIFLLMILSNPSSPFILLWDIVYIILLVCGVYVRLGALYGSTRQARKAFRIFKFLNELAELQEVLQMDHMCDEDHHNEEEGMKVRCSGHTTSILFYIVGFILCFCVCVSLSFSLSL